MTTKADANRPVIANLLQQNFSATAPNQTYLVDITYIPTQEGFLYLANLEAVFYARLSVRQMDKDMETALVEPASHMALTQLLFFRFTFG